MTRTAPTAPSRGGIFSTPRPVPGRLRPALAGTAVILLALPVFAIAGWPLSGWALAAVLWVAGQLLGAVLTHLHTRDDNLAASGVAGIGMSFRAIAIGIPLVAVTVADARVGVSAALLYVLAFSLELAIGLVAYFGTVKSQ
jgi:hypothetical protein